MSTKTPKTENKSDNMLAQAGILAAAGIVVRIIGLLYRSPLTGIIGDEGNGYYNYAYNCYAIILLISAYSIPSAISKVIAGELALGRDRNAQRVFHGALLYVLIVSGAFSVFVFFGAGLLTYGHSVTVLRVFSPTILLFGFLGVLRGYFQAMRTMVPTSVSQILEQLVNAAVSLLAAWLFIRGAGDTDATTRAVRGAVGSALGTGAGVLTALLFMLIVYGINRGTILKRIHYCANQNRDSWGAVMKLLVLTVTPFILSTFIYNFSTMLNQTIFQRILIHTRGFLEADVAIAYGIFSTKAVVIANIPIALASALSSAMMPNLSGSFARGDSREAGSIVDRALKATLMVSVPCAAGLFILSRPIVFLLFPQRGSLDEAAALLSGIAVTVVFYSISTVTNAVLQGIGRMNLPVVNAAVALFVQGAVLALLLLFTGLDNGALVIAMILYSLLMCVLNERSVRKHLKRGTDWRRLLAAPLLAAAVMAVVTRIVYQLVSLLLSVFMSSEYLINLLSLLPALLVAVWIYGLLLIRFGGVSEEELLRMPKGRTLVRLLKKARILS
ncbi:MAG: polysaccharide biosynthesis protein [Lachnospiraceae bacterium]|nr:polysaccharide biosynthesis protein [Lachnospiraceae bacterium]